MVSSGIRLGAWDYLKWKNEIPVEKEGKVLAAKLIVYQGEPEEYFTFITPEAYLELEKWISYRKDCGEDITKESWVLRNVWDRNKSYRFKPGIVPQPKKLHSLGVKRIVETALWTQGLRHKLEPGKKRHEFPEFDKPVPIIERIQFTDEQKQEIQGLLEGKQPIKNQTQREASIQKWHNPMSDENKMYILKEKYYHGWCQICRGLPSIKLTYQFDGIKLIEYWCDKHKDMIENGT